MTRQFLIAALPLAAALFASGPASAEPGADGRAVAQCRAEVLRQFPAETIRSQRIASISGNSRRTRVAINVTADRRYSVDCTTGADGDLISASWTPPVETRLAGGAAAPRPR